jgi:(S)-2-hydroxy-acid oxidase
MSSTICIYDYLFIFFNRNDFKLFFKACESVGTIMILSTVACSSIEQVSKASPNSIKWFQTFIYKDRNVTRNLVKRAENNGFKAIVLTVDTPVIGQRFADTRNRFRLPSNLRFANFDIRNFEPESKQKMYSYDCPEMSYVLDLLDPSITWKDVEWLKSITRLPIVLKGILTREDALLAIKYGVSAILVSNHGARQLDGVPATVSVV